MGTEGVRAVSIRITTDRGATRPARRGLLGPDHTLLRTVMTVAGLVRSSRAPGPTGCCCRCERTRPTRPKGFAVTFRSGRSRPPRQRPSSTSNRSGPAEPCMESVGGTTIQSPCGALIRQLDRLAYRRNFSSSQTWITPIRLQCSTPVLRPCTTLGLPRSPPRREGECEPSFLIFQRLRSSGGLAPSSERLGVWLLRD